MKQQCTGIFGRVSALFLALLMVAGTLVAVIPALPLRVSADNPVLQISFVGYRTAEVAVAPAQTVVDVTLAASSIDVDEVVVVGYGVQKKSLVTGAISSVKGSALETTGIMRAVREVRDASDPA